MTQFGRALDDIGSEYQRPCSSAISLTRVATWPTPRQSIGEPCPHPSPDIFNNERSHAHHQDWLVKRFREEDISTIAGANAFLPIYVAEHNEMFAKVPRELEDFHRPISEVDNLAHALSIRVERHVSPALVVQFENDAYILENTPIARARIGKNVIVERHLDGRLTIRDGNSGLLFRRSEASTRRSLLVDLTVHGPNPSESIRSLTAIVRS